MNEAEQRKRAILRLQGDVVSLATGLRNRGNVLRARTIAANMHAAELVEKAAALKSLMKSGFGEWEATNGTIDRATLLEIGGIVRRGKRAGHPTRHLLQFLGVIPKPTKAPKRRGPKRKPGPVTHIMELNAAATRGEIGEVEREMIRRLLK